jgi:hypothetical protein
VATELVTQKLSLRVSPAQQPTTVTESVPIRSAFAQFVGEASIAGARMRPPNEMEEEVVATEAQPLKIICSGAERQPSLRVQTTADAEEQASLEAMPLQVNPGDDLALWTDAASNLTLQLQRAGSTAPRVTARFAATAPFKLEIEHCEAVLGKDKFDLTGYSLVPESEGCDITISANPRMTLVLDPAGTEPPQLLKQGALRVAAVDLSSEQSAGGRKTALLADSALSYPDYPTIAALTLQRRNGIKFDQLEDFFIEELQLAGGAAWRKSGDAASDGAAPVDKLLEALAAVRPEHPPGALRVRLYGTANEIRERRPAGDGRDLRLTLFDTLSHHEWLHDAMWIGASALGLIASLFTVVPRK